MTETQLQSHQEQMEAYRRDFAYYWRGIEHSFGDMTPRAKVMLQTTIWQEWLAERTGRKAPQ